MEQTKEHDQSIIGDLHATGITSINYLNERFFYLLWMRTRDEISTETANRWMIDFVSRAKEIHRLEIMDAYLAGFNDAVSDYGYNDDHYNETFRADKLAKDVVCSECGSEDEVQISIEHDWKMYCKNCCPIRNAKTTI